MNLKIIQYILLIFEQQRKTKSGGQNGMHFKDCEAIPEGLIDLDSGFRKGKKKSTIQERKKKPTSISNHRKPFHVSIQIQKAG